MSLLLEVYYQLSIAYSIPQIHGVGYSTPRSLAPMHFLGLKENCKISPAYAALNFTLLVS